MKNSDQIPNKRAAQPVDCLVGKNIKRTRLEKGISLSDLASKLGVAFQQIQKYESGTNRISASRLYEISRHLGVDVAQLFDGVDPESESARWPCKSESETARHNRQSYRLMQAFNRVTGSRDREKLLKMIQVVANEEPG